MDRTDQKIDANLTQASSPDVHGWQPIETAPKDDSAVLVYCPIINLNFVAAAFWDTVAQEWQLAWTGISNNPVKVGSPTHWMPLPEPPVIPNIAAEQH